MQKQEIALNLHLLFQFLIQDQIHQDRKIIKNFKAF